MAAGIAPGGLTISDPFKSVVSLRAPGAYGKSASGVLKKEMGQHLKPTVMQTKTKIELRMKVAAFWPPHLAAHVRGERRPPLPFAFLLINHFLCIGIEDGPDFGKRGHNVASTAIRWTTIVQ